MRFGVGLLLARILGPDAFGVVAAALVFTNFIALFLDQGLSVTLVRRTEASDAFVATVRWLNIVSTVLLAALTFALAQEVARFFGTPELAEVLRWMALFVLLQGATIIPRAVLARRLDFKSVAKADLVGASIGGGVALAAAGAGAGYWALVVQSTVSAGATALVLTVFAGRIPFRPRLQLLPEIASFSTRLLAGSIFNYASRNLDNAIVGRLFGPRDLALYSLSYRTLMVPVMVLGQVANSVALPVYARLQRDRTALRRYYLLGNRVIAITALPAMTLVIVEADPLVRVVFGEAWVPAVLTMQILAVTGMRQSIQTTIVPLVAALGDARWLMRWNIGSSVVYVASFFVGASWGIEGVAAAYTVVGLCISPIPAAKAASALEFSLRDYATALVPAFSTSLAMAMALVASGWGVTHVLGGGPVVELGVGLVVGIAVYLACLRWVWKDASSELLRAMRLVLARGD